MYRVAIESVLGFGVEGGRELVLRPCIPDDWPGFSIRYRVPGSGTTYDIRVERAAPGVNTSVRVEDAAANGASNEVRARDASASSARPSIENRAVRIPISSDGGTHGIVVSLGRDLSREYRERADV